MAERRMFSKTLVDSDLFLGLPQTAQLLYFHMSMRADDDGFLTNVLQIQKITGTTDADMKALLERQLLLAFGEGIVVIRHWRMHNYIRKDTYTATKCKKQKKRLALDENNVYVPIDSADAVLPLVPPDTQSTPTASTQGRKEKNRKEKNSINKERERTSKHPHGEYRNVFLTDEEHEKLLAEFADSARLIDRLSEYMASKGITYSSHYATIRSWAKRDREDEAERRQGFGGFPSSFAPDDFFDAAVASTYQGEIL